jgi:hypothetical protein
MMMSSASRSPSTTSDGIRSISWNPEFDRLKVERGETVRHDEARGRFSGAVSEPRRVKEPDGVPGSRTTLVERVKSRCSQEAAVGFHDPLDHVSCSEIGVPALVPGEWHVSVDRVGRAEHANDLRADPQVLAGTHVFWSRRSQHDTPSDESRSE